MSWMFCGPFFELSFIMEEDRHLKEIIDKIQSVSIRIKFMDELLDQSIESYIQGYPYDEHDPQGQYIHHACLNLEIETKRKRQGLLFVDRIAEKTIALSFCFNWEDASEFNQPGIREDEIQEFIDLLVELYKLFYYKIGGIGVEADVKSFFNTSEGWPHEDYSLRNLDFQQQKSHASRFLAIVWNTEDSVEYPIPYKNIAVHPHGLLLLPGGGHND
jgi:hypothetical protein